MAIVNKLINYIGGLNSGASVTTKLKSGNLVTITKSKVNEAVEVARLRTDGRKFLTVYKKQADQYVPTTVDEILPCGIFRMDYRKDGSKLLTLKVSDGLHGRKQSAEKGFYKMLTEKILYPKGKIFRSYDQERKLSSEFKKANLEILQRLQALRKGKALSMLND